jgi:hypothetical protein
MHGPASYGPASSGQKPLDRFLLGEAARGES